MTHPRPAPEPDTVLRPRMQHRHLHRQSQQVQGVGVDIALSGQVVEQVVVESLQRPWPPATQDLDLKSGRNEKLFGVLLKHGLHSTAQQEAVQQQGLLSRSGPKNEDWRRPTASGGVNDAEKGTIIISNATVLV